MIQKIDYLVLIYSTLSGLFMIMKPQKVLAFIKYIKYNSNLYVFSLPLGILFAGLLYFHFIFEISISGVVSLFLLLGLVKITYWVLMPKSFQSLIPEEISKDFLEKIGTLYYLGALLMLIYY